MNRFKFLPQLFFLILLGCMATAVNAQTSVGNVASLEGTADVLRGGATLDLAVGDDIYREDTIRTKSDSLVQIELNDGSRFTLDERSKVEISDYVTNPEPDSLLSLARGRLRSSVGSTFASRRESYRVRTDDAVMGVQGTDFTVSADPGQTSVFVYEGTVSVQSLDPNFATPVLLTAGQFSVVTPQAPAAPPTNFIEDSSETEGDGEASMGSGSGQDVQSGGDQQNDPLQTLQEMGTPMTVPPTPNPPGGDG